MRLSTQQSNQLVEQGYVTLPACLDHATLQELRVASRDLHATLPGKTLHGAAIEWEQIREGQPRRIQQLLYAHKAVPEVDRFIRSHDMLELASGVLGPDLALFESKLLLKAARVGGSIPWHQDYAYWKSVSCAPTQLNCLIYLDAADAENGSLQVIPGSHRHGLVRHREQSNGRAFSMSLPERSSQDGAVRLDGDPGTMILFSPLLLHGSAPNVSQRDRRVLTVVYSVPGVDSGDREVLQVRRQDQSLRSLFPMAEIRRVTGDGPHGGQCASDYRRREVWKLACAEAVSHPGIWLEVHSGAPSVSALAYLAARSPAEVQLVRVQELPADGLGTDKVLCLPAEYPHLVGSRVDQELPRGRISLLYLHSEFYERTRKVLSSLSSRLGPQTVLVFDRFYDPTTGPGPAAEAFFEFVREGRWVCEYLARADHQVAVRLIGPGPGAAARCCHAPRDVQTLGLSLVLEPTVLPASEPPASPPATPAATSMIWSTLTLARRALRKARRIGGQLLSRPRPIPQVAAVAEPPHPLFPVDKIPRFLGDGAARDLCPTHARREELWRYAVSLIAEHRAAWCECGVGEGESFDWFALHKPPENLLFGLDSFEGIPEPWCHYPAGHWKAPEYRPTHPDVRIVRGRFTETLTREEVGRDLGNRIGMLHVDCDLYSSTRTVLQGLNTKIGPGSILIFDEFYGYAGWEMHEAKAFFEYVVEQGVDFEYLARSDFQVAVRILAVHAAPRCTIRAPDFVPRDFGITLGMSGGDDR